MKERVNSIDIAKGIGIIAIIMGHMGIRGIEQVVFTFNVPVVCVLFIVI